jgi:hypothetical protein
MLSSIMISGVAFKASLNSLKFCTSISTLYFLPAFFRAASMMLATLCPASCAGEVSPISGGTL